ncbi:MAG TPA: rhodanese-like domain-containing protein [Gemmatimonadaceae bacterium]|jgi:hydroxyacylglutathione hydrolase|nr:rhodanese-like domain-containing protein [Gemmatimonadaceae bacterium]
MRIKRLHDELLAQTSYVIGCDAAGLAAVIDPTRDVERYIAAAVREKLRIAVVAETHIHADFVSGARALARATGATLVLSDEGGAEWRYQFANADGARLVRHGDAIDVGHVRLTVRHTPGHTPEHIAFVVTDRALTDKPVGLLSGDFIFVGDVGRPDLLERAAGAEGTMDRLARRLFRSLRATADLPDHLQIWPGHGAGSACGKALGAMPSSTIGYERLINWAFQISNEDDFVARVLAGQPEPPRYFARMKSVNRDGPPAAIPDEALAKLDLDAYRHETHRGAVAIDVRSAAEFAAGHIPGTLNIPVSSSFATWAGWLVPSDRDIIVLADDPERVAKARYALMLIGVDRVIGWCGAHLRAAWRAKCGALPTVESVGVDAVANGNHRMLIDVRNAAEWSEGHVPTAAHHFLGDLIERTRNLPRTEPIAVHCQGGTRSAIAASLLQAEGFTNVVNVRGGFRAWQDAKLPVVPGSACG